MLIVRGKALNFFDEFRGLQGSLFDFLVASKSMGKGDYQVPDRNCRGLREGKYGPILFRLLLEVLLPLRW